MEKGKKHMKVLMINSVCGIRSTGRICTDLAVTLEKQGHEVKIAYGREKVPEQFQKYAVRIGTDWDVKFHGVKARLFDGAGFGSRTATEKFIEWVKEYDPDVIHLHNIHGYYINIEVLFEYLKSCGKRIIWTLHDCWAFTGHCTYFDYVGCDNWKTECMKCPQKKEYPKCYFMSRAKQNYEKKKALFSGVENLILVTPSAWLQDLVKQSYMSEYFVKVIYNGIDRNIFKPTASNLRKEYGLKDKKVVLGVAAIWDRRKGKDIFIDLSKLLSDDYQIILVGLTKKQIAQLPSNIIGIERTNNPQELAALYSLADVYINPTLEDNYPTTNLEAIACGTPVVTFNTGGSPETIPLELRDRFIAKEKNAYSIKEVLDNTTKLSKEVIIKNHMNNLSPENNIKQYLNIIESSVWGGEKTQNYNA